jgi:predicted kinase
MLVAMAGLPGTGKSALAARLAAELGGVVLNKDVVRAVLFPPPVLDYSRGQNDFCMQVMLAAAQRIVRGHPQQTIVLDGRTFLQSYQIRHLREWAVLYGEPPRLIECVCDDEVAKVRLERDLAAGVHPARNRTFQLYLDVKAAAEPIPVPHLTLDTGRTPLDDCVAWALEYLRSEASVAAWPNLPGAD